MKISNEVKVGIVAVIAIVLTYLGFNYLKGSDLFSNTSTFYAVYPRIDGLSRDNPVLINGYKIGKVKSIDLMKDRSGRILVAFDADVNLFPLSEDVMVKISSTDLFGSKALVVIPGESKVMATAGDTLQSDIEGDLKAELDARFRPLEQKTQNLIGSIDSVVTIVQYIFNEDARRNLTESFQSINYSIEVLSHTLVTIDQKVSSESERFSSIMSNIDHMTSTLDANSGDLSNIIQNFSDISDSLAQANLYQTMQEANETMANLADITKKINEGEGTVGMLINNDSLYHALEQSSRNLDLLLEDMRLNPNRYVHVSVFGKKNAAYIEPETQE